MSGKQEIEVKLSVDDLERVAQRLQTVGAVLVHPRVFERNVRYDDAQNTLTPRGIVLRLREDGRVWLTYKGPGEVSDDIISRFEAEVEVSDFEAMAMILEKLGYHRQMVYEKYRTTYALDDTEVVLDEMPYGDFVEIEGDQVSIRRAIERLGLEGATRHGASYARLFDYVRRNMGLAFRDLTFENFATIEVPESAFSPPE